MNTMNVPISQKTIDIGANLTNRRFAQDLTPTLERAKSAQLEYILVTGTSESGSLSALQQTKQHPDILRSTAGVHPHHAKDWQDDASSENLLTLLKHDHVVAVGECGLDFNRNFSPKDQQLHCFEAQLEIAKETHKPLFLHERDAHESFGKTLSRHRSQLSNCVVHCFTGSRYQMEKYLDMDCHLGVTGWICDERRGEDLREALKYAPVDRIMIETDAPYLTPRDLKPKPTGGRNEPAFLPHILGRLAVLLNHPEQDLADTLLKNTRSFFSLAPQPPRN